MMKFNVVDRRTYLYEATWRNPQNDVEEKLFYYYINPLTLTVEYNNGREMVIPIATIGIYGEHNFVVGDKITLNNGMTLQVRNQTFTYREGNIRVRHMLKPYVQETAVELE
jgi:hypothetical protein